MNRYRHEIDNVLAATAIRSATTFSVRGKTFGQLPAHIKKELTAKTAREYLLYQLQHHLYAQLYCTGSLQAEPPQGGKGSIGPSAFLSELSDANSGTGHWEAGWTLQEADEKGRVLAEQDGLRVYVEAKHVSPAGEVRFPKEFFSLSPGFYMAVGDRDLFEGGAEQIVRFYWNLTAPGAARLIHGATSRLNCAQIPFRMKVLDQPDAYSRCDAGVLYIRRQNLAVVTELLASLYADISPYLKPQVPFFTKKLADGLGFAEDPGDDESFGQHRCRLLAEGILLAHEQGKKAREDRLHMVQERFLQDGILLEAPHCYAEGMADYEFVPDSFRARRLFERPENTVRQERIVQVGTIGQGSKVQQTVSTEEMLHTAEGIAESLVEQAIWQGDRCTWMGDEEAGTDGAGLCYATLGADLYGGTSGIALFLAELYIVTRRAELRETALGAMRQALALKSRIPAPLRAGLYTGWAGIAYAAKRIGGVIHDVELMRQGQELAAKTVEHRGGRHEYDMITGASGAITGMLAMGLSRDVEAAVELGDRLLRLAQHQDGSMSWPNPQTPDQRHLTGFSHGASGGAFALLELYHATGNDLYRRAAELAFCYEDEVFDAGQNNWPDFRGVPKRRTRAKTELTCACYWCHGAPGSVLSRLRAYEITGDDRHKQKALLGLHTTRQDVERTLHSGNGNYSLCHGLSGNAEVLMYGEQVLGRDVFDGTTTVQKVVHSGIERYTKQGQLWPGGIPEGGHTPGLMLGDAGIGLFYLRLYDPQIPSVLLIGQKLRERTKATLLRE